MINIHKKREVVHERTSLHILSSLLAYVPLPFPTYSPPHAHIIFCPCGSCEPIILISVGGCMKVTLGGGGGGGGTLWQHGRCDDHPCSLLVLTSCLLTYDKYT